MHHDQGTCGAREGDVEIVETARGVDRHAGGVDENDGVELQALGVGDLADDDLGAEIDRGIPRRSRARSRVAPGSGRHPEGRGQGVDPTSGGEHRDAPGALGVDDRVPRRPGLLRGGPDEPVGVHGHRAGRDAGLAHRLRRPGGRVDRGEHVGARR